MGQGNPNPSPETRFQAGNQAAAGHGRPRGPSIATRMRILLEQTRIGDFAAREGLTLADEVAETVIRQAVAGDFRFCQEILNRMDGKVPQQQVLAGSADAPIETHAEVEIVDRAEKRIGQWRALMTDRLTSLMEEPPPSPRGDSPKN